MAAFNPAVEIQLAKEAGWTAGANDPGGETYLGIARNYNPNFPGWKILDKIPGKKEGQRFDIPELEQDVKKYYLDKYWTPSKASLIQNQSLANLYFYAVCQWYIDDAIPMLQKAAGAVPDGKFGPITQRKVNNDPSKVYANLKALMDAKYKSDPNAQYFLKGWLTRLNSAAYAFVKSPGGMITIFLIFAGLFFLFIYQPTKINFSTI